jgi:Fic family protein
MKKPELPPHGQVTPENVQQVIDIMTNPNIISELTYIEQEHTYWEVFKYKVRKINIDPALLWIVAKMQREQTVTKIKMCEAAGFSFKYRSTAKILKHLHNFDLNLGGILDGGGTIIPTDEKNKYLISSIMEEAIASSQLEGAVTTREVAKEMLRTQRKPRNISEKMILNNYLTIKKVIEVKDKKLSKELILEIHSIISKGTLDNSINEGKFRENNKVKVVDDVTNEIFYTPPDFNQIESLIKDLCAFANDNNSEGDFVHPIIKGIILHFLIGYIHPFVDGNGRTARAVFYWYMVSRGYWLVEYLALSRIIMKSPVKYARAYLYTEYDDNDLTYFIDYNLRAMDLALKSLKEYINRKIKERKNIFEIVKNENVNDRQAEILKEFIIDSKKTITIKEVENSFDVVYQTARTDLLGLVKLGYLHEKYTGKKIVFFRANNFEKKIDMLNS